MPITAREPAIPVSPAKTAPWTFLTNHTHGLFCICRDPEVRMRDVAVLAKPRAPRAR